MNGRALLMTQPRLPRSEVALEELGRAADEYAHAKEEADRAQLRFEAAAERMATVRRVVAPILSWQELFEWERAHPQVRYAGSTVGDAIEAYLLDEAYTEAWHCNEDPERRYGPWRTLEDIVRALDVGGFQFKTTTPSREVNAALINLKVTRAGDGNMAVYATPDADQIREVWKMPEQQKENEPAEVDPDDVPFE